ncbi:zinc-ribbon domain-containing protein [Yanshouia hominis]|uniref:Zinc-ribbon domain-containing protein n=1 Tax=Yanshouia hominis TaxID=2763673 RepID=A0ABR7NN74_9FIRM|nr:zinc-ribbon domain-containing protein [Yanshouia hominis]MBC8577815.1 zinc-ribbon domain-containing protein [Yanshouia hominis]
MYCKNCGKEIEQDSKFCKYCGENIAEDNFTPSDGSLSEESSRVQKKPSATYLFFRVFLGFVKFFAILLILMFGCGVLLGPNDDAPAESTPSTAYYSSSIPPKENDPRMTLSEFSSIKTGMTYAEVCEIVGSYGVEQSRVELGGYQTVIVGWDGTGQIGANANVTFQNGKVIAKAQAGLS